MTVPDPDEEIEVEDRLERIESLLAESERRRGEQIYLTACATCHGVKGDGNGPSAEGLDPPPRDFTRGVFKWRSTVSGVLPLDEDLFRTISNGVPGTMMVSWKSLLSERDRRAIVEWIQSFSPRFAEEEVYPDDVVQIPDPVLATAESVARGREVFRANKCWECHGESGAGDGPSADTLKDSWGRPIRPFDFTLGRYRGGDDDRAIYRTFFTGLDGTPMPAYEHNIDEEDRWPLVHYVRSLQRRPSFFERLVFETP